MVFSAAAEPDEPAIFIDSREHFSHSRFAPEPAKPQAARNPSITQTTTDKVAIIIDDMGYRRQQGLQALALPGDITYAIIPHSPNAHFLATEANKHHKELMLHAPMSNVHNIPLGKNGLTETMSESHFKQTLNDSLNSVPHISGVNNHMGSLLTQKTLPMEWLMHALSERQLYFIDSRTTSHSVAWKVAQDLNIPSLKRDVFLDHQATPKFIHEQFQRMIGIAKKRGYAVAIAHPHPTTLLYLKTELPKLKQQNIELVTASALVRAHSPNMTSQKQAINVTQITKKRSN